MPKFLLTLEEKDDKDTLTGRKLSKTFKHPVLPRIGEEVTIRGNGYPITNIDHRLERIVGLKGLIIVYAHWWTGDFKDLWADESWDKSARVHI